MTGVVIAFGARAEAAADLHVGDRVRVDGRLGQREWTAEDGTRVGAQRIIAERIRVIETATAQEVAS
jgi:single-stranded DNA-binding protein